MDCDWCGRAGRPRQYKLVKDGLLRFADPVLCDVCSLLISSPPEVEEFWMQLRGYNDVIGRFEAELERRFRDRSS